MFKQPKEGYDPMILIKLCEDSKTAKEVLENLGEALRNNFDADVISITYNMKYSERVSNTHSCPMNGIINFTCNEDMVMGYEGFTGRIDLVVTKDPNVTFFGSMFGSKGTSRSAIQGINFGSGGGGGSRKYLKNGEVVKGERYSYDFKIFTDDFDSIRKNIKAELEERKYAIDQEERLFKLKYPRKHYTRPAIVISYSDEIFNDNYEEIKD